MPYHSLARPPKSELKKKDLIDLSGLTYAFGICVIVGFLAISCEGRRESFYPSFADAQKDGAVDRGWIPDFLPPSSRSIHEVHKNSPSIGWCSFDFLVGDSQSLRNTIKSLDQLPTTAKRVPNPGESWWPAALEGNLDLKAIHDTGLDLYIFSRPETSVTREVLLFAIDWRRGHGFVYLRSDTGAE